MAFVLFISRSTLRNASNPMLNNIYAVAVYGTLAELTEALDNQGDPNSLSKRQKFSALSKVSHDGELDKVRLLVERGAVYDAGHFTPPAELAAERGHIEVVRFFLSPDLPEAAKPSKPGACLTIAALRGQIQVIRLLLEHGLDPSYDEDGVPPIVVAAGRADQAIVDLLAPLVDADLAKEAREILELKLAGNRLGRWDIT